MASWDVTAGTGLEFDTVGAIDLCLQPIDSSHFLVTWAGNGSDGFALVLEVDSGTNSVTAPASALEFDTVSGVFQALAAVDGNHQLIIYRGDVGGDLRLVARILEINTSTWEITSGTPFSPIGGSSTDFSTLTKLTGDFFVGTFYSNNSGDDIFGIVLEADVSTNTVSSPGSEVEIHDGITAFFPSIITIDSTHCLLVYSNNETTDNVFARVLEINTGTGGITVGSALTLSDILLSNSTKALGQIDSTHFLYVASKRDPALAENIEAIVLEVNTSTNTVTEAGSWGVIAANTVVDGRSSASLAPFDDGEHFVVVYTGQDNDGFAQVVEVNTSTWAVTPVGSSLEFDIFLGRDARVERVDGNHFLVVNSGASQDGYAYVLEVELPVTATFQPKVMFM